MAAPVRLVAFDVDGTLLRGATVCELLAEPLGFAERMRELERNLSREEDVRAASEEMAGWYAGRRYEELCQPVRDVELAPEQSTECGSCVSAVSPSLSSP